jgi:hypothetical protein
MMIVAGTLAFLLGLRDFGRSYSTTRWPVIPGRVLTSEVVPAGDGRFLAQVEYEYILAGRVRRGRLPASATRREQADSVSAVYPAGKEIPVGFDPGDPEQSVLRPHLRWWSLALTLAGAVIMVLGLWPRKVQP